MGEENRRTLSKSGERGTITGRAPLKQGGANGRNDDGEELSQRRGLRRLCLLLLPNMGVTLLTWASAFRIGVLFLLLVVLLVSCSSLPIEKARVLCHLISPFFSYHSTCLVVVLYFSKMRKRQSAHQIVHKNNEKHILKNIWDSNFGHNAKLWLILAKRWHVGL